MTIARTAFRRTLAVAATAALAVGALAACSTGADATGGGCADDLDAALEDGGKLTYWSWTPSAEAQVAAFEEAYPNVEVELVNAGTGTEQYTEAAERDQGRLGRARRRADRVLRACRSSPSPTRSST